MYMCKQKKQEAGTTFLSGVASEGNPCDAAKDEYLLLYPIKLTASSAVDVSSSIKYDL